METIEEKVGDVKVLHLRGRLDLAATAEFESRLKKLIEAGERRLVLDCKELKYVSSSGIGALVGCGKQLENSGVLIFAGLTHHVASVFDMSGLARVFTVCKTKEDALRHLGAA